MGAFNTCTLGRLSFRVSAERQAAFKAAFGREALPFLQAHGLVGVAQPGRPTPGCFSRLLEVQSPSEFAQIRAWLPQSSAWRNILKCLGQVCGESESDGLMAYRLDPYAVAGDGIRVPAGNGLGYWRTYDTTDGLVCNVVLATLQSRDGYLWFVTPTGISRFDGKSFVSFAREKEFPYSSIPATALDSRGALWIGTYEGLVRFDNETFTTFSTKEGLPNESINALAEDIRGTLWVGTRGGLGRFDGERFRAFTTADGLPNNHISSLIRDNCGLLWIGTYGGLARFDGEAMAAFTAQDGFPDNRVSAIMEAPTGAVWIVYAADSGLARFDGDAFAFFSIQDRLLDPLVRARVVDRSGQLWFGTLGGMNRFDGETFTDFTTRNGLPHNNVQSIFEDREGHLWVGSYGGVSQYFGSTFATFTTQDGLANNDVWAILEDRDGHLWFGTNGGGVCRFDGHSFITFTTQDGLPHNKVMSIFQDRNGHLWFGTRGGACRYDGKTFTTFTTEDGLSSNTIWHIAEDVQGDLWFGTNRQGVCRYDGKTFTTVVMQDGRIDSRVWTMLVDRSGDFWFGTHYSGLNRFDGHTFHTVAPEKFSRSWVSAIAQDRDGTLWFGTQHGGVVRYDGRSFKTFTCADGLADNWVSAIAQDRRGHLWFGTSGGGVARYDGQIFQTLTQRDGLAGNVVYAIVQDRKGDLWFGTSHGVTRYRPSRTPPSPVFIDAVVADRRYRETDGIEIPDSIHLVAVEFHAMGFRTPSHAMVYQYRLEGFEAEWRATRSHRVEYQDLPLGTYTFHVRAVDQDLNYSTPASVRLSVVTDPRVQGLAEALNTCGLQGDLVGNSMALRQVQAQLSEVAPTTLTVLILGETGTGKGLAARAVHALSTRRAGPFIQVNCGAIPEGLVESELFGHERGAFTGAISRKLGKVEVAKGGTLFLDEVGDLAPEAQAKLLQLLEDRTFERVGGTETLLVDVRVIAATNCDLIKMVNGGRFREDLYFRLHAFPLRMPPLRERREDIPLLAAYFMERMNEHMHRPMPDLAPDALAALQAYDWPGNVRELEHVVQRTLIVCRGPAVHAEDIFVGLDRASEGREVGINPLDEHLRAYERRYLKAVLDKTGWVIRGRQGAAALLGVPESTLRYRLKKLGIKRT